MFDNDSICSSVHEPLWAPYYHPVLFVDPYTGEMMYHHFTLEKNGEIYCTGEPYPPKNKKS